MKLKGEKKDQNQNNEKERGGETEEDIRRLK